MGVGSKNYPVRSAGESRGEKAITYSFARAGKRVQFPDGRDPATHTGAYEKETPNASELRSHYPAIYWLVCWISISGEDKA